MRDIKGRFLKSNKKRLESLKDGRLRIGPEFVRVGLSQVCNFNCLTCWDYSPLIKKQKSLKQKIGKDLVFNLIDDLAQMGTIKILFSGRGEPFTHPHLMDFIKKARDKNILVYLQTNLSLVKDVYQLAEYLGKGANLVCVHLSAFSPEMYFRMHPNQKEKAFHQILEKIKVLAKKKIPIRLVHVVNKLNYQEIPKALELNQKLKTRLHLEMMDYDPKSKLGQIALKNKEKKQLIQILSKLKEKYRRRSNIIDFINQLTHSALGIEKLQSCSVGYFISMINEFGKVKYCFNRDKNILVGDLNKNSFKEIWHSEKYDRLRKKLLKGEFLDVCQNCIKKRGYNFKIRMYTDPQIRDSKFEEKVLDYYSL